MKLIFTLIFALASFSAGATDVRMQKAERIARILDIEGMLVETQRANADAVKEQVQLVIQELRRSGAKEEWLRDFEKAADQMAVKVSAAWDPKQATRIYSEGLLDSLTDEEFDDAEQYFNSPKIRKAYLAALGSQAKMTEYINARTNVVMKEEFARFMEQARQAVAKK